MTAAEALRKQRGDDFADEELAEAAPPGSRARKWMQRLQRARHKDTILFGASFAETTVVPIPIEVVLIPYMLAERTRIWRIATVALLGCLAGSMLGYAIGYFVFDTLGTRIIDWAGWGDAYEQFKTMFNAHGFWAILAVGVLPIPFQVAMLAAGAAGYSVALFVLAAVIARGVRYYGLGWLVKAFGPRALRKWRNNKLSGSLVAAVVLAALWGLMQWLGGIAGTGT